MIIVSDTSPLCNLALIDYLWILHEIYQTVIIPDIVADELAAARDPAIPAILQIDWIQMRSLRDPTFAQQLQHDRGLDPGEANAIALAIKLQADDLLIDERLGRREALKFGLSIIGILGILIIAKQRNLIPTIRPVMDALIDRAGFRVSPQLYQQVLNRSNEA